jgi:aminoglycoside phosphotransferase (APT) family kinase protein
MTTGSAEVTHVVEQVWPQARWTAAPLSGGMTNRNWKVCIEDDNSSGYVVQVQMPTEQAHRIGIDRALQRKVLAVTQELGFGPRVKATTNHPLALVTEFVPGPRFPEQGAAARPVAVRAVAEHLRQLHLRTAGFKHHGLVADPFVGSRWALENAAAVDSDLVTGYAWARPLLAELELVRGDYVSCLLHSDLSPENLIMAKSDEVVLIDWEYSAAGDPYFDLGEFAEKNRLEPTEEVALVEAYEGIGAPIALALTRVYRLLSMMREGLWAVIVSQIDFTDFDHASHAARCLERMGEIRTSPEFAEAFDLLSKGGAPRQPDFIRD